MILWTVGANGPYKVKILRLEGHTQPSLSAHLSVAEPPGAHWCQPARAGALIMGDREEGSEHIRGSVGLRTRLKITREYHHRT